MAAGRIIVPPYFPARDRNGDLISGALLYVWDNETTTLVSIYADEALTIPAPNPAVANTSGRFPEIWAEAGTEADPVFYRVGITKADGESPGNPFIFDNYRPSVDFETAALALAEAAAASAEQSAIIAVEAADSVRDLLSYVVRTRKSLLDYLPDDLREAVVNGNNDQDLVEYINVAASVPWAELDLAGYTYLINSRIDPAVGVSFVGQGTFLAMDAFSDSAYPDGLNMMIRANSGVEVGCGVTFDGGSNAVPNKWIWGTRNTAPVSGLKLCGTFKNLSFIGVDVSSNLGFWTNTDITISCKVENVGWRGINLEGVQGLRIQDASVYRAGFDGYFLNDCENIVATGYTSDKSAPPYRIYDGPGGYAGNEAGFLFGHFNIRNGRFSNFFLNDNRNAAEDGWGIGEDGSQGEDESRDLVVSNGIIDHAGLFGFDCTGKMVVRGLIVNRSARQGIMLGLDLGGTISDLDIEASVFDSGQSEPSAGAVMFLASGPAPRTINTTSGSPVVTVTGGSGFYIAVGQRVVGAGIPDGATVLSFSGNDVTLSANATATATNVAAVFRGVTNFQNIRVSVNINGAPYGIAVESGDDGYTNYDNVEIGGAYATNITQQPILPLNGSFPNGVRLSSEVRRAEWWGVTTSTVENPVSSSIALQRAMDGISACGGGELFLPPRTVHISETLYARNKVSLIGSNPPTVLRLMDGSNCTVMETENFDYFKNWTNGQSIEGYVQKFYIHNVILNGNGENQTAPTNQANMCYGLRMLSHQWAYGKLVIEEIAGEGLWSDYNPALMTYFRNDVDGAGNSWPQKSYQTASTWEDLCVQDCLYEHVVLNGPPDMSLLSVHTNYCGWDTLPLQSVNAGPPKTSIMFPGEEIHSFRQGTNCHIGYANLNGAVCGRAFYANGVRLEIDTMIATGSWGQVLLEGDCWGHVSSLALQLTAFQWNGVSHPMLHCAKGPAVNAKVQFGKVTTRPIGSWAAYNGEYIRDDFGHQFSLIENMEHQPLAGHLLVLGGTNRGGSYGDVKAFGMTGAARDGRQSTVLTIESGATDIVVKNLDSWRCDVGIDNKANNARINIKNGTIRVNESGATGQVAIRGAVSQPAIASVEAVGGVAVNFDSLRKWDLTVIDNGAVYRNCANGTATFDMSTTGRKTANVAHNMWRIPQASDVLVTPRWASATVPDFSLMYGTLDATNVQAICNVVTSATGNLTATVSVGR